PLAAGSGSHRFALVGAARRLPAGARAATARAAGAVLDAPLGRVGRLGAARALQPAASPRPAPRDDNRRRARRLPAPQGPGVLVGDEVEPGALHARLADRLADLRALGGEPRAAHAARSRRARR